MAVTSAQKEFAKDLFGEVGHITLRAMMGGMCIYADGTIFAIIGSDEQIYIKAKGALANDLAAVGSKQFAMTRKDGSIGRMGYWTLPEDALDDPTLAHHWATRALGDLERE